MRGVISLADVESSAPRIVARAGETLQYGGQAVVEGVMMRSPHYFAVACRKPDGGIVVQREAVDKSLLGKLKWMNKPFLRGTLGILDAMILGSRALSFASKVQLEGEKERADSSVKEPEPPVVETEPPFGSSDTVPLSPLALPNAVPKSSAPSKINDIAVGVTIVISLALGFAIFRALPTTLGEFIEKAGALGASPSNLQKNALDGAIRAVIFFAYILLISQMAGIKTVFEYHGAEHKAINTLEGGLPLERGNALLASRIHPRCGTSFIIIVMVVDFLICLFLPRPVLILRILLHIAVMPFVAGIAYEAIKFAGKYRHNRLMMAVFAPSMWSQYLTTREPKPDQVDVALAALYSVLEGEGYTIPESVKAQGLVEKVLT
jgi:uncharacterized protein YqhQ